VILLRTTRPLRDTLVDGTGSMKTDTVSIVGHLGLTVKNVHDRHLFLQKRTRWYPLG
jgi:hypothetical protein